jgi:TPR repeat protein
MAASHTLKRILAGVVLCLILTGGAAAEPIDDAVAAFKRADYATTLSLIRPLAEQGHADAQDFLGSLYEYGLGVPGTTPRR